MPSVKPMLAAALALGIVLASPGTAHADVVVASSGPSSGQFPVGKKLSPVERITLKVGDSVTVLGSTGTRVIRGPGIHRVGARGPSKRSTFAVLTRQRSAQRVRTGAVRGDIPGATLTSPNMWYVDVSKSGTMCVANLDSVRLWRPGTEGNSTYLIAKASSPDHIHVNFEDGAMVAEWDGMRMPLAEGATYKITGPGGGAASEVTFAMLDEPGDDPEALAEDLIAKGCTVQLELLASTMMTAG